VDVDVDVDVDLIDWVGVRLGGTYGILYKTLLAKNCQNLKMATIGRNM